MQRKDLFLIGLLGLIVILIFYPLIYTDYVYTDEVTQLQHYKPGSGFYMFIDQGRWITELLFSRFFSAIDTIHEINRLRIFSLIGWLVCLPIWYISLQRIVVDNPGYRYLPFFTCLYLVLSLPFGIAIQWASCMELFLANTLGLLSGVVLYHGIYNKKDNRKYVSPLAATGAAILGILSLFTYQNGMCCFLIPFLLHFIIVQTKRKEQVFITGIVAYFVIYAVYYVLFKLSLSINHISASARTGLHIDPIKKLLFFFARPLARSYRFSIIADENSRLALAIYIVLFMGTVALAFLRFGKNNRVGALKYITAIVTAFLLSYLPSFAVAENYTSNRTLLALNLCVWIVSMDMLLFFVKGIQLRTAIGVTTAGVLIVFGWYNFRREFLKPVHEEYVAIRDFIQHNYNDSIKTVYFIQPPQDAFEKKYGIASSMDEYGVPSTFPTWVPEDLTRQLIYEKTGNKQTAAQLTVKYWPDIESFNASGEKLSANTLLINVPAILSSK
jgi:hypothetical protein